MNPDRRGEVVIVDTTGLKHLKYLGTPPLCYRVQMENLGRRFSDLVPVWS